MDDETLRRAIAGERAAYEVLGRWLNRELSASFSRRFGPETAGELRQQAAVAILQALDQAPTSVAPFRWWMWKFVKIRVLRWREESRREEQRSGWRDQYAMVAPREPGFEVRFSEQEKWAFIDDAIEKLPEKYSAPLQGWLAGKTYREIAVACGIGESTARTRVLAAKRRVLAKWSRERKTRASQRGSEQAS